MPMISDAAAIMIQELERRKNEAMLPYTIDEAIKQYKKEAPEWSDEAFKRSKRLKRRRKD